VAADAGADKQALSDALLESMFPAYKAAAA
jgi:hypothetical protein